MLIEYRFILNRLYLGHNTLLNMLSQQIPYNKLICWRPDFPHMTFINTSIDF